VHMVASDPTGQFVIANDAGLDLTLIWRLDMQAGRLLPSDMPVVEAPSGSAPRHFAFHPNGKYFYNLYEHDAKVAVYDYDGSRAPCASSRACRPCLPNSPAATWPRRSWSLPTADFSMSATGCTARSRCSPLPGRPAQAHLRDLGARGLSAQRRARSERRNHLLLQQKGDSITSFRVNPASGASRSPAGSSRWEARRHGDAQAALNGHKAGSAPMPGYTEARCVRAASRQYHGTCDDRSRSDGRQYGAALAARRASGVGFDPAEAARKASRIKAVNPPPRSRR